MYVKYFVLIVTILLILVMNFLYFSKKPKEIFFPRFQMNNLLNEREIEKKIKEIEEKIKISPNDIEKKIELGIYYYLLGPKNYSKAANILDSCWRMGSSDKRIFYYLGSIYGFLKLNDLAINEYKKYLFNDPYDLEVKMLLGNIYFDIGQYNRSIEIYNEVLKTDYENLIAINNLGICYFHLKDYDMSSKYLDQAKQLCIRKKIIDPPYLNFYLGKILYEKKNYVEAKEKFEREIVLYPEKSIEARVLLAKTYLELNDKNIALNQINEILKIIPEHKEARNLLKKIKRV